MLAFYGLKGTKAGRVMEGKGISCKIRRARRQ
jgi:hypothetical protein